MDSSPSKKRRIDSESVSQPLLRPRKKWSRNLGNPLVCMTVGNPFGSNAPAANIIVGNEQGEVVILNEEGILATLDTKGGPIQSILLHDVTGFGDTDVITGDSNGTVTIFSRQQILSKTQVGAPVRCLDVFHDAVGDFEILAGDSLGALTSFMPHSQLWKLNIADTAPLSKRAGSTPIRALLPILISDKYGIETAYLLVCNGAPFVHFVQDGARTMSLRCPSIVNSMCSGYFRKHSGDNDVNDMEIADGRDQAVQIVLGCSDGYVYLLEDFKITRLLNVEYPITNVVTFKRKSSSAPAGPLPPEIDILACTGHFNDVRFYQDGTLLHSIQTNDWVHGLAFGDVDGNGEEEVVLGMLDNTIEVWEIGFGK